MVKKKKKTQRDASKAMKKGCKEGLTLSFKSFDLLTNTGAGWATEEQIMWHV